MKRAEFLTFRPHPLLSSGHAQTILAAYSRPVGFRYDAVQHAVRLADGDSVVLHDDRPQTWRSGERVVFLIHGLAGCHASPYLVRTAGKLNWQGVRTIRIDLRGTGAAQGLARYPGHAGRSEDLRAALAYAAELCGESPIAVVGFSMGGNILLKMLGEDAAEAAPHLDSAMAVAPPIDLQRCIDGLQRGLPRIYNRAFTRMLLRTLRQRGAMRADVPEFRQRPPRDLLEFDERYTARLSGFASAEDYYVKSSAAPLLCRIQRPTLILTAQDDPLIPADLFQPAQLSPTTSLCVVPGGGHVGFYGAGGRDPDRWWLDWRIVQWVASLRRGRPRIGHPPVAGASPRSGSRSSGRLRSQ